MDVIATYELPVPVWVTCATLGAAYPSGYGPVQFDIVMPLDHPPAGAPPAIEALDQADGASDRNGKLVVWTQEYGAFIPESLQPATALLRVVVTRVVAREHPTRTWAGPDDRLVEVIAAWFNQVRTWVEVLTGQDLDPQHRVYDAEAVAPGLNFIFPSHDGNLALTISTSHIRPVQAQEWRMVMAAVRDGHEPPLEELLSRDARAAHARGSNRRAIIDAATAVEVVLAREVTSRAEDLPEAQRDRLNRKPMLGTLIDIAEVSGLEFAVPFAQLHELNKARVEAVHYGRGRSAWDTANLVQIAIDFLGNHGLYRRSRVSEPDGSEWLVHDEGDLLNTRCSESALR